MPNDRPEPNRNRVITDVAQYHCVVCALSVTRQCTSCNFCEECCTCGYCVMCRAIRNEVCAACHQCITHDFGGHMHCTCRQCGVCGGYVLRNDLCAGCALCYDCCSCEANQGRNGTRIQFFHSQFNPIRSNVNQFKINKFKRLVSIELEVDNIDNGRNLSKIVKKWGGAIVTDGSLSETGFEINTNPANGDRYFQQIDEICNELDAESAVISKRCGFHIHLDAKDFSYYDLRKLIFLYSYIEPALFLIVPPVRRSSDYCKPCGHIYSTALTDKKNPKDSKQVIIDNIYKEVIPDRYEKYNLSRRHALNLHSWFYRGTVECRLMSGTKNALKIKHWSITWLNILDAAMKYKEKEILQFGKANSMDTLCWLLERHPETRLWLQQRYDKYSVK